jgi:hypothetical protein
MTSSCVYSSMIYDLCILETLVIVVSFSCVYSSMIYDLCILETLVIVVSFSCVYSSRCVKVKTKRTGSWTN